MSEKLSARLWNYGDAELAKMAEALEARIEALERQNKEYREGLLDENSLVLKQQAHIEALEKWVEAWKNTAEMLHGHYEVRR